MGIPLSPLFTTAPDSQKLEETQTDVSPTTMFFRHSMRAGSGQHHSWCLTSSSEYFWNLQKLFLRVKVTLLYTHIQSIPHFGAWNHPSVAEKCPRWWNNRAAFARETDWENLNASNFCYTWHDHKVASALKAKIRTWTFTKRSPL